MNVRDLIHRLSREDPNARVLFTFSSSELDDFAKDGYVEVDSLETGDGADGSEVWIGA
jgi:hypothetical protein